MRLLFCSIVAWVERALCDRAGLTTNAAKSGPSR